MKDRLLQYIKAKQLTQKEFCTKLGVASNYISCMKAGMSADKLNRLGLIFADLNINWLSTGEGDMLKTTATTINVENSGMLSGNSGTMTFGHSAVIQDNSKVKELEAENAHLREQVEELRGQIAKLEEDKERLQSNNDKLLDLLMAQR